MSYAYYSELGLNINLTYLTLYNNFYCLQISKCIHRDLNKYQNFKLVPTSLFSCQFEGESFQID